MIVSDCRPRRRYLFGVCDGMGGADYGEIAALIAVETMSEYWENASSDICGCAQDANLKICSAIESNESKRMGATFAAALVEDNIAHIYNVGDSRVYLIHNNSITQLSEDHTYAQMLVNQGIITQEQAKMHNGRNVLTQHLGIFPDEMLIEAFCAEPIKLDLSDTLLLCSDGLTDMLSDEEILDVCCSNDEPSAKGNKLIGFALKMVEEIISRLFLHRWKNRFGGAMMDMNYYKKYEPIFGSWHIVREIGEGSFGKVFEIEREDFGHTYKAALKAVTIPQSKAEIETIRDEGMDDESITKYFRGFVEELIEEFHLMSKLKGESNIVSYEDHRVIEHEDSIGWDILIRMELLRPLTKYTKDHH